MQHQFRPTTPGIEESYSAVMESGSASEMDSTLTNSQRKVLFALLDVVIPSIEVRGSSASNKDQLCISQHDFQNLHESITREMKSPPSEEIFRDYMTKRLSDSPIFVDNVDKAIEKLGSAPRKQLGFVLWFMR